VVNDTKVIPARLLGVKPDTGAAIEVLLLRNHGDNVWEALVRPGKKLRPGAEVSFGDGLLTGTIESVTEGGNRMIRFSYTGIWEEILDRLGEMPLPPYIHEKLKNRDRYQTVYARQDGSAAAPTAGLHFTPELLDRIRSRVNYKSSYALSRCVEEMCCCEDFAVSRLGGEDECEAINYKKLTKQYHTLLQQSPVEIFYCGRAAEKELRTALRDALITLPRGEIDYEIGTDLRMNALEDQPRFVEEALDVTQGKLVIGWRLGECMEDPDQAALLTFNTVFGAGSKSKLFTNLREKRQLCYYADSSPDLHKGLLLASAGIDFEMLDEARDEIFRQLEAIRQGDVSEEELSAAKAVLASELKAMCDNQGALEGFLLSQALDGLDYGPLELAALVEDVTKEDVVAVAQSLDCDLIYFLKGEEPEEDEEEEEEETEPHGA
jgi:hypothetical protein